ncbi:MAG: purine-binding chemotaxis protein CheW [bacterium]|nr:purine-binding chemotaxis protein CheW [bacterium]
MGKEYHQYLVFLLGKELYGVDVDYVKEVLEFCRVTRVPAVPEQIKGVINLRGDVIPVIDLTARFYKHQSEVSRKTCIVITEFRDEDEIHSIGMMIDAVNSVIDIPAGDIKAPPGFGSKIRPDFISGILHEESSSKFIILLDIKKVLDAEELASFNDIESSNNNTG